MSNYDWHFWVFILVTIAAVYAGVGFAHFFIYGGSL